MSIRRRSLVLSLAITAFLLLFVFGGAATLAGGPFAEPDVLVIHELFPEPNTAASQGYGWVAADVGDLNGDDAHEFVVTDAFYSDTAQWQGKFYLHDGSSGDVLFSVEGDSQLDLMGHATSPAGDMNMDGVPDYAVGAPFGAQDRVFVYSGADNSVIHEWNGSQEGFGYDLGGGEDFNNDGYGDLVVGATRYSDAFPSQGRLYLISGLDGATLWATDGISESSQLGSGVGIVGDINGDNVPDVAAAAATYDNNRGQAYVFSGSDGATLLTLDPTEPFNTNPNAASFGRYFASAAGDVNNDSVPDVFIGDYAGDGGAGRAYVYSGVDGAILLELEAEGPGDGFGPGRAVGDVDGDNHDDLFVASYLYSSSTAPAGAGKGYLISGADGSVLNEATGTNAGYNLGVDALSVGDVNGDGGQDYLITGNGSPSYVFTFVDDPTAVTMATMSSEFASAPSPLVAVALIFAGMAIAWQHRE